MAESRPPFSVFPALGLRGGRCVGADADAGCDEMVLRCAEAGARWLHVVDLDATAGEGDNGALIARLAGHGPLRLQVAGGLEREADLDRVFAAGAARAVIGAAGVREPGVLRAMVERWGPERIAVNVEARGRRPVADGWQAGADLFDVVRDVATAGVRTLIHTDVDRDAMGQGPNLVMASALASFSGAEVIVSGGIATLEDIEEVNRERRMGIRLVGAIVSWGAGPDLVEAVRRVEG